MDKFVAYAEKIRNAYGEAYKRICPNCGDVVVISTKSMEYEKYCRYCGVKFDKTEIKEDEDENG